MNYHVCSYCKENKNDLLFVGNKGGAGRFCKDCWNEYHRKKRRTGYKPPSIEFLDNEYWYDIPGYEGLYKLSNFYRVLSTYTIYKTGNKRLIIKKPVKNKRGYWIFTLKKGGGTFSISLHRAIALVFIPNPNNYPEVLHLNDIKDDNRIENLKWGTHKENMELAAIHKLYSDYNGERNPQSKLTAPQVVEIRESNYSAKQLTTIYGISQNTIWSIKSRKSWKSIT